MESLRADGFSEDDEVFGFSASGGYAEHLTAAATMIAKKPEGIGDEQAAAIPVAGLTAWQALFDGLVTPSGSRGRNPRHDCR